MKTHVFYLNRFLKKHHIQKIIWLNSDASTRHYARVWDKKRSYILMDTPVSEKPKEFIKIDQLLLKNKIAAPKIYAKDLKHGFMLMEDFGDIKLADAVKNKKDPTDLYIQAIDMLVRIQKIKNIDRLPTLTSEKWISAMNVFLNFFFPYVIEKKLSESAIDEFHKIWKKLAHQVALMPKTICLGDYHLENIMLKEDNSLGILDFQDAVKGPAFYDLVALLENEREPISETKFKQLFHHYLDLRPVLNQKKYIDLFPIIAAQWHTRVIGVFVRLCVRLKKTQYLKYLKNDWALLERDLKSPLLKEYKAWLKKYVPSKFRGVPNNLSEYTPIDTAMMLAAGLGTRMRHLTQNNPKPLVKINDTALCQFTLDALLRHPIKHFTINTYYKGKQLHTYLKKFPIPVYFSDEKEILNTGGGVKKALPHLIKTGKNGFFVVNSDTIWLDSEVPLLKKLEQAWDPKTMDCLMAFVPKKNVHGDKAKGDYFIQDGHPVRRHPDDPPAPYMFIGAQILHPRVFKNIKEDAFPIWKYIYDIAEKNNRLGYVIFDGLWFNVGTPEAVKETAKFFKRIK